MAWNDGRALTTDELLVANNWLHNEAKGDTDLLAKKATEYGMNNAQRQQLGIAGEVYAGGRELQDWEKQQARTWATGKTGQQVADKAKEMGVTAEQLGQTFGWTGADSKAGGYGTTEGLKPEFQGMEFDGTNWRKPANKQATGIVAQAGVTDWNVTPDQLVENRTNNIIKADSPLMQQARGGAMQQMNERGLVNSSIAVGAAQDAVLGKAIEIAKPDAQTYAESAQFNAGSKNTASMFNAGQTNTYNLADRELTQKDAQFTKQLTQQQEQFLMNNALELKKLGIQVDLAKMDDATRMALASMNMSAASLSAGAQQSIAEANRAFQSTENKTNAFNRQWETYTDRVLKITVDPNITPQNKDSLIAGLTNDFKGWAAVNQIVGDFSFVNAPVAGTSSGTTTTTTPETSPVYQQEVAGA